MAGFKFATTFLPFTVILNTGASEETARPASNLALFAYPNRVARTQDTTSERWVLDLGGALAIKALLLIGTNYTTATVRTASDSAITANLVSLGATTIGRDRRVNKYQAWCDYPANVTARRYVEVVQSNPLASATYFETGTIAAFDTVTTMSQNPGFQDYYRQEPEYRLGLEGGAEDVSTAGPSFLVYDFKQPAWKTLSGVQANLEDLLDLGTTGFFAMWENNGDTSKAYIFRRIGPMRFSHQFRVFDMATTVREPS